RRLPRPPLFPYTTLFRSVRIVERRGPHDDASAADLSFRRRHRAVIKPREDFVRRARLDLAIAIDLGRGEVAAARGLEDLEDEVRSEEHTSELQSLAYLVC